MKKENMKKKNYTSPDQQVIEGFELNSVQNTMTTIAEYCDSNKDFHQLLGIFNKEYIPTYNKRKISSRNELLLYIKRNFNTWYNSAINPYMTISPAQFINSDIYNKFGTETVVYPVCNPVFDKSRLTDITFSFRCFAADAHPFVGDLRLALESMKLMPFEAANDAAYQSFISYVIDNFSIITETKDFTFNERPYIITLYEVCRRLSFISLPIDYGPIVFNENEIEAFFSISNSIKLERVITALIENFVESFDNVATLKKRPVTSDVAATLKTNNDFESFMEFLFDDLFEDFINDMDMLVDADFDANDFMETMDEKKSKIFFDMQVVISACCSKYFTVFGQYLQLIIPEKSNPFIFSQSDDEFLNALKHEDYSALAPIDKSSIGAMFYYTPPGWYTLSAFGYNWFNLCQSLHDRESCPFIPADEYQDILALMLITEEDDADSIVDNYLRRQLADPEKADSIIDALTDLLSDEILSNDGSVETGLLEEDAVYQDIKYADENKKATGNCYICGVELGKTAMKNHILKAHGVEKDGQDCYLIKLEGAYDKDYWLFIDVPLDKRLSDIDAFLRKIWLECCGHLSEFRNTKRSHYEGVAKNRKINTFSTGDKVLHEYDFGSTTETLITIVGSIVRNPQKAAVRLLARNVAPEFQCTECGAPAKYICTDCMYDCDNPFYCKKCGKKHIHDDMFLPVTNSPRLGVCGYAGELDTFGFDLKNISKGK